MEERGTGQQGLCKALKRREKEVQEQKERVRQKQFKEEKLKL